MSFETKMYFSGSMEKEILDEAILTNNCHRLYTFAYPKEAIKFLDFADSIGMRAKLMIDSGAFSAWNIGKPVQLEELLAYDKYLINTYGNRHDFVFISLDVIPGERNRSPTAQEIAYGMDVSYNNFKIMQSELSFPVLPVYHSGEPSWFRNKFLNETDYICLSMNQTMSEKNRVQWAREAFVQGFKFHGLAATGNKMLTMVDWYSVDSAGWIMVAAMGSILFPGPEGLHPLSVSKESPDKHKADKHITTLYNKPEVERIISSYGFTSEELQTDYLKRMIWNMTMWNSFKWVKNPEPFTGLFNL